MNIYLKNLRRIEFPITFACTGRCKHCSEGEHINSGEHIDGSCAAEAVRAICSEYKIESLMTFGGEPLLYPEDVCKIHSAARECGIKKRSIITNGYFSKSEDTIRKVAKKLALSGVNSVLLSADAFHQETIPLEPVMLFAEEVLRQNISIKISPAWLQDRDADNPYNRRTREIIDIFAGLGIESASGNVIFPAGNALKYLSEYFEPNTVYHNPYEENPRDMRTVSINPNGDLLGGNIYRDDVREILRSYSLEA